MASTLNNNKLISQIEDLKTTLNLNRNLLYCYIENAEGENEKIKDLIKKSKSLWENKELLIGKKIDIEMKTEILKNQMNEIPSKIHDEINVISSNINKKKNELTLKDSTIKKLKIELEKARKNAFFKTARTEILVTPPSKTSVEFNQEIINAKVILSKVSNRHSKEKKKSEKLKKDVNNLKVEMDGLKKTAVNLNNKKNDKNKQITERIQSIQSTIDESNFLVKLGYNINMDKNEKDEECEEEEKEESEESSEDENSEGNRQNNKVKQKEYDNLNDQYNKLKKQIEDCQNKINGYKNKYKEYMKKLENMKK